MSVYPINSITRTLTEHGLHERQLKTTYGITTSMGLRKTRWESVEWIHIPQYRDQWRTL